jgi:S1-C subfamily serine protease
MNALPRRLRAIGLGGLLALAGLVTAHANPPALNSGAVAELVAATVPAFVFIAGGSGVLISADGLVLSNSHVIGKQRSFNVRLGDGRSFKANVLGHHVFGDLALLQLEGGKDLPFLPLGDSDAVQTGEFCMAIGNPLALGLLDQQPTISTGVISAKNRLSGNYADGLVTDASINPGNSGGPLINGRGELIGINGQIQTRMGLRSNTGLGFAIPVNRVKRWLPLLKAARGGEVRHGRLDGLEWENPGRAAQLTSVPPTIRKIMAGSDGERAGFKVGDKILRCQGEPIQMAAQLYLLMAMYPHTESLSVVIERGGEETTLTFKLEPVGN